MYSNIRMKRKYNDNVDLLLHKHNVASTQSGIPLTGKIHIIAMQRNGIDKKTRNLSMRMN